MQALRSADYQDTMRGDPSNAVIVQRGCRSRVGKMSGQVGPAAAMEAGNRLTIECLDMLETATRLYIMFACADSDTNPVQYV